MSGRRSSQRGGLVGPLILIGLGVVFLLNNLGVLDWSIWEVLLRLWPILLVAAGLDLILGRRSTWGSLLALVLTVALLAVALWLSQAGMGARAVGEIEEITQPLDDLARAEIAVDPGVGTLRIRPLSDSQNLVEGTMDQGRHEALEQDFSVEDDIGAFTLRTKSTSFGPFAGGWTGDRLWDLQLTTRIPLAIETDLGAGQTDLDLTGLTVERLDVDQGIGQAVVTLPEEGGFQARIQGAIGQTVVVIPEALAARVRLDTGIAGRQMPEEYDCDEDVCTSPGYGTADQRVDLDLGQAIGSLVVRH